MTMMGMTASDNEDEDNKVGTMLLLELLVEFISRPVSHTFSQVGTELLTLTVPHVEWSKMTPRLKCQLRAMTQTFRGLS